MLVGVAKSSFAVAAALLRPGRWATNPLFVDAPLVGAACVLADALEVRGCLRAEPAAAKTRATLIGGRRSATDRRSPEGPGDRGDEVATQTTSPSSTSNRASGFRQRRWAMNDANRRSSQNGTRSQRFAVMMPTIIHTRQHGSSVAVWRTRTAQTLCIDAVGCRDRNGRVAGVEGCISPILKADRGRNEAASKAAAVPLERCCAGRRSGWAPGRERVSPSAGGLTVRVPRSVGRDTQRGRASRPRHASLELLFVGFAGLCYLV
jgi:hypothetical protein